jgi:SSS family solute:Na+ symporter/sodium/proline symporter
VLYIATLAVTILGLLLVAIERSRLLKTHSDFMVAGRQLSATVLVATLLCSWIGSGSLFGGAENAYRNGLASLWMPAGGWAGLLIIYLVAGRARKFAQFTVPELLETRYHPLARVLGTIAIVISYTVITSYQFKGGGNVLHLTFGIPMETGMIIVAIFVIAFTALAGMSSVAYVDLVIGFLATFGTILALPFLLHSAGGWETVRSTLPADHFQVFGHLTYLQAVGFFLPTFTLMVGNQNTYQKFFSARSERDARISVVGWIIGTVVLETVIVLLAVVGSSMFRTIEAWTAIPHAARFGVPALVGAILLAAIFAKVISTGNNYLFSPASNLIHDVYRRFIRPAALDREILIVSRLVVVALGLVALSLGYRPSVLKSAFLAYSIYGAGITPVILAVFFWRRATTAGALASIASGTIVCLVWDFMSRQVLAPGQAPVGLLSFLVASPGMQRLCVLAGELEPIIPALPISLAALVVVSLLSAAPSESQLKPFLSNAATSAAVKGSLC